MQDFCAGGLGVRFGRTIWAHDLGALDARSILGAPLRPVGPEKPLGSWDAGRTGELFCSHASGQASQKIPGPWGAKYAQEDIFGLRKMKRPGKRLIRYPSFGACSIHQIILCQTFPASCFFSFLKYSICHGCPTWVIYVAQPPLNCLVIKRLRAGCFLTK